MDVILLRVALGRLTMKWMQLDPRASNTRVVLR